MVKKCWSPFSPPLIKSQCQQASAEFQDATLRPVCFLACSIPKCACSQGYFFPPRLSNIFPQQCASNLCFYLLHSTYSAPGVIPALSKQCFEPSSLSSFTATCPALSWTQSDPQKFLKYINL